ncbi:MULTISPECIES: phytanoyl-CoA dioxygenase family protein [unclassified Variovorax]|uniref:phytanoyl-CoA dioxygenase family protein n=1 Tax=unclassified Variovorax TaxID=663243 RepID=UPI001BD624FD|nr:MULTISPECIES: phytanoyl-CoA dioxygenase family protein [unclassified Variovorax]
MLTPEQIASYERDGYLLLPELFTPAEIAVVRRAASDIYAMDRPEVWRGKDGEFRLAFGVQHYHPVFDLFLRHPRLVEPTRELLGGDVYCHQYKLINKQPFGKLDFPWHQDFANWSKFDGMPEPRALNISVFLDEVNEFNGPVIFIPGAHKEGLIRADVLPMEGIDQDGAHTIQGRELERIARANGMVAPKGKAGTAVLFHPYMPHASSPNQSPWSRSTIYLTSNRVDNHIKRPTRPEYVAHTDFTPLRAVADNALLTYVEEAAAA